MATTIQLRRDSATNWETENPILSAGEIGVDLTNNKFKLGDGSTAWNSLPYQGANADLTNYYTKSETNALLNEKENSLTPISPIIIEDVVDNPITGMEFSQDETELYQDINDTVAGIHIEQFGNDNAIYYTVGTDVLTSSYIEMPFEIGQRVTTGKSGGTIGGSPVFGKYVGNDFIPILLCSTSNSAYINNGFFLTSTDVPIQDNNFVGQVVGGSGYSGSEGRAFAQITDDSYYYIVLTECICSDRFTGMEFEYYCTQGTTEASRLEEITHCRIYPIVDAYGYAWAGSSSSNPFTYEYIGLYDATDTTYTNNLFDATSTVTREIRLNVDALPNKGYEVGDTVWRILPSSDSGKHLLDGALLQYGSCKAFIDYIEELYNIPVERNWTQPILTANGTMGGSSFAVSTNVTQVDSSHDVYKAFDGVTTTSGGDFHSAQGSTTGYIDIYNPVPLKITNFKIYNQPFANRASSAGNIYGSNDGTNWILITTYTNSDQGSGDVWDISLSLNTNSYNYYRLESTAGAPSGDGYWVINEIEITATYMGAPAYFTDETSWQTAVSTYGVCGKFVYDSVNNTVRLPKITGIVEGTIDANALGDLIEAGLPNASSWYNYVTGVDGGASGGDGSLTLARQGKATGWTTGSGTSWNGTCIAQATLDLSQASSIYGNNTTVQPQTIKGYLYIVIANTAKTNIEVDIDEIATDLNGKADVDLSNMNASQSAKNTIVNWGMPDYANGISLSSSSFPYTAPSDGYVYVEWYTSNYAGVALYSDNHIIDYQRNAYNGALNMAVKGFVSKNSILTLDGNSGTFERAIFYPLKGVN